uniref:Phage protein n=1 Tax=Mammaliicoccus phage MSShimriz1 TaxID=3230127 RepID=A0AAU8GRM5_9VIRU
MKEFESMQIEIGGYILSVSIEEFNTINGKRKLVDYHHIKTKRQKNFRKTKEFYNEFKKIKVSKNKFDELHEWVGIYKDATLEDVVNNKEMVLEILGLEEHSLLVYTKKAIKEYMEAQVENELNELDG